MSRNPFPNTHFNAFNRLRAALTRNDIPITVAQPEYDSSQMADVLHVADGDTQHSHRNIPIADLVVAQDPIVYQGFTAAEQDSRRRYIVTRIHEIEEQIRQLIPRRNYYMTRYMESEDQANGRAQITHLVNERNRLNNELTSMRPHSSLRPHSRRLH